MLPSSDLVHAAMGETEADHFRRLGFNVAIDEPYQHYQFAGRADVMRGILDRRVMLHLENRTRFPDLQEVAGSYNAKRAYLGATLAGRLGIPSWRSETHVLVALWSAEAMRAIRLHLATVDALCPDSFDRFGAWWRGEPPIAGRTSTLVVLDPAPEVGRRARAIGRARIQRAPPRYRDYADAAGAISRGRS